MPDLLRANGLKQFGGRKLAVGDEFLADKRFADALLLLGIVTLVQRDIEAIDPPPDDPVPVKRGRGRPKGSTKRRFL